MTQTPEQIAAGRTKAQRAALLAFKAERDMTTKEAGVSPQAARSLWDMPPGPNLEAPQMLLARDYTDWPRLAYTYRLTPLGEQVQRVLQAQENTNAD